MLICKGRVAAFADFGPAPRSKVGARNGRERVKCGPERPIPAAGEVRRHPQEPATTRGNRRDQARKTPTKNGWVSQLAALRRRRASYHGCNEFRCAPFGDDSTLIAILWLSPVASGRLLRTLVQSPNTESNSTPKAQRRPRQPSCSAQCHQFAQSEKFAQERGGRVGDIAIYG